ncbi:hypothetical protein FBU31_003446 [Coemansia sp. 'formosensis']|nr:hypothetical protein FBU31_003446 [Coemansia sp. 'formosensis']
MRSRRMGRETRTFCMTRAFSDTGASSMLPMAMVRMLVAYATSPEPPPPTMEGSVLLPSARWVRMKDMWSLKGWMCRNSKYSCMPSSTGLTSGTAQSSISAPVSSSAAAFHPGTSNLTKSSRA